MNAYITKNKDGEVYLHFIRPFKLQSRRRWIGNIRSCKLTEPLPENINPQWTDDEPVEVKLIFKPKE